MPLSAKHPGPHAGLLALLALFLVLFAAAPARAQQGSSPPADETAPANVRPVFEFHSAFWTNLHLVLYEQARIRSQHSTSRGGGAALAESGAARARHGDAASPDWNAAVDYYVREFADRDLLFDSSQVAINNRLAEMETCPDLSGRSSASCESGLRPELIAALERAAPAYRAHGWAEDDRGNRAWIKAVAPLVRQMGGALSEQLARVYRAEWPRSPIRVDVVCYGGPLGAYTTLDPVHISISSTDLRNQGPLGFEILFHEGSHALAKAVVDGIVRECRARNMPIPRDLWHALLFYTTGQLVKRMLEEKSMAASYTPYANRFGLFDRGWQNYQRALQLYWQPYLDGKIGFDRALAQLVEGL
jgi:hypothetical protein